jgi:hypothetical protein
MRDTSSAERFLETEQPHWLSKPAVVCCPHCGQQAAASGGWRSARLACGHCGHSVSTEFDETRRVGPVYLTVRGRCGHCGRELHRVIGNRNSPPARRTATVRCPGCQHRTALPIQMSMESASAVDPWFGLPLWLQVRCCGEVLWARNPSHLAFLANYVGARLRERAPYWNRSTVSRLPKWMKAAKNREEILAAIEHLRLTLVQPQRREA